MQESTLLLDTLRRAARGEFPPPDGAVEVLGPPPGPTDAVVAFTAHHIVAADVDRPEVLAMLPHDDLGAPMKPPFLQWLAERIGAPAGMQDLVMVAPDRPSPGDPIDLRELPGSTHPRMARATQYRTALRVFADSDERAVLAIGRGLAGRWEVSLEVDEGHRGTGLGRLLVGAAPALIPQGEPLFAQVSPGNVASVRAFLAAGYRPICAEVLFLKPSG